MKTPVMTFGSLFAGIGGFDLGFERAGMVCKWQVEIDEYANRVLAKHWPHVRRWPDVRTWPQPETERVDVIVGGFPCQDISYAGRGAGLDGERSGLFFEAVRVVQQLQPRIVVLENVAALLARGLDRVLGTLAEIGFDAEWHCIPAAAVGAPHIRDRVFILAYAVQERKISDVANANESIQGSGEFLRAGCDHGESQSRDISNTYESMLEGQRIVTGGTLSEFRDACYESWWKSESGFCRVANGVPFRMDRLRGLGNAVVPHVAQFIGERIVDSCQKQQK